MSVRAIGPHRRCASLPASNTILLDPLQEELNLNESDVEAIANSDGDDRFTQVIQATVRVTVNGVCGSGTVVGRDDAGNAIVLTNAHVAGTSRGRTVNLERWNSDGSSEKGTGTVIASGYGRGMSVDFALLRCNTEFANGVTPIPLADRYPNADSGITTYGCPRCEWPSLQVLKLNRSEGQVLSWRPEAIGGRSGSSIIDYSSTGPRVVGLLTWGGGGEGLGQSTPFLLDAMRGKLPASIESLPNGVHEVSCQESDKLAVYQVPSSTSGEPMYLPVQATVDTQDREGLIDAILERNKPDENGLLNRDKDRDNNPGPIARGVNWLKRAVIVVLLCAACGVIGFFLGRAWK
ncbi:MAG: trypsin-like peptidase domain-containing protein [Pirellulaceae bacterium]